MFDFIDTTLFTILVAYSTITTGALWVLWARKRDMCERLATKLWFNAMTNGVSFTVYGIALGYDWKTTLAASAVVTVAFVSLGLYQGLKLRRMLAS